MIQLIARAQCPFAAEARAHLSRDARLAPIIARVGACTLSPRRDYFSALCQSIITQQISTAVAKAIYGRFVGAFPRRRPTPPGLLALPDQTLRTLGLSRQKISYMRSLAQAFQSGDVPVRRLRRMDDEQVIECLTAIKGVGRWTAEIFLMFVLNRPDVLPAGDLGLRRAARLMHGLCADPSPDALRALAEPWRPFRSVASWYLWRGLAVPAEKPAP
jgi:DNA-3-methyladenine glycosylase II